MELQLPFSFSAKAQKSQGVDTNDHMQDETFPRKSKRVRMGPSYHPTSLVRFAMENVGRHCWMLRR